MATAAEIRRQMEARMAAEAAADAKAKAKASPPPTDGADNQWGLVGKAYRAIVNRPNDVDEQVDGKSKTRKYR